METKFYIKIKEKVAAKIISVFLKLYGQAKSLADKNRRSCRKDAVINDSMKTGFTISKCIIYKQYHTKT